MVKHNAPKIFQIFLQYLARHMLKISWKSVHAFSRNVANRKTNKRQHRWKHNLRRSAELKMLPSNSFMWQGKGGMVLHL